MCKSCQKLFLRIQNQSDLDILQEKKKHDIRIVLHPRLILNTQTRTYPRYLSLHSLASSHGTIYFSGACMKLYLQ